ncbi:hypothetical protein EK904_011920 [Melospiza melodia maxima]|nr:hypothetical protein EK904_011920 [Melospiza melodia maxima]
MQLVWDETLAKSAEAWAATCIWDHGPSYLLRFLGQNLSVRTGRYRSILQLVKPWYDEVKDYAFPYPQDCNPRCPMRCYGPMCTHYTQMVWATSNRIGCAIHTCHNMNVWGSVWRRAVYLVCNYAPKGNWIGEAPYKVGVPCSACPPSYGGSCIDNLCFPGEDIWDRLYRMQQHQKAEEAKSETRKWSSKPDDDGGTYRADVGDAVLESANRLCKPESFFAKLLFCTARRAVQLSIL